MNKYSYYLQILIWIDTVRKSEHNIVNYCFLLFTYENLKQLTTIERKIEIFSVLLGLLYLYLMRRKPLALYQRKAK